MGQNRWCVRKTKSVLGSPAEWDTAPSFNLPDSSPTLWKLRRLESENHRNHRKKNNTICLSLPLYIYIYTLHCITLHYTTLHYITLYTLYTLHYITLHYITLHYITLHYITLHYIYIQTHTHTPYHTIPHHTTPHHTIPYIYIYIWYVHNVRSKL